MKKVESFKYLGNKTVTSRSIEEGKIKMQDNFTN
jgi:hypothetical protein